MTKQTNVYSVTCVDTGSQGGRSVEVRTRGNIHKARDISRYKAKMLGWNNWVVQFETTLNQ